MNQSSFEELLRKILKSSEQEGIFSNNNYEDKLIDESIRYLRYKGFTIVEPKKFSIEIRSIDDLIKYFYLMSNSKHPEEYMRSSNKNKDRAIAKQLVEGRMSITGASKEYALSECGEIIRTVFENEEEFKFKHSFDFSVFGQNNFKWVTDKAIQLMNKNLQKKEEEDAEKLRNTIIAEQDDSDLGFDDLDELLSKIGD